MKRRENVHVMAGLELSTPTPFKFVDHSEGSESHLSQNTVKKVTKQVFNLPV